MVRSTRIAVILLTISSCVVLSSRAEAQDSIPSMVYFAGFEDFSEGDYGEALEFFDDALRGATKIGMQPWIDSTCYHTMIGECHYRMGNYAEALDAYEAALRIQVAYPDWIGRMQLAGPTPLARIGTPWGDTTLKANLARYPQKGSFRIDQQSIVESGGKPAIGKKFEYRIIQAEEIVRCTALAMRRRIEILGPLCEYDPLSHDLFQVMSKQRGIPNHWSKCWIDTLHGLALLSVGKEKEALPVLSRGLTAMGQFHHNLTSTIFLELGRRQMAAGEFAKAMELFHEAAVAAFYYLDASCLEDALRLKAEAYLAKGNKGPEPSIVQTLAWARAQGYRPIAASLAIPLAEMHLLQGDKAKARSALQEASIAMGRMPFRAGIIGARCDYVNAMLAYHDLKLTDGNKALAAAMERMQRVSPWLFQIRLLEGHFNSGSISTSGPITLRGAMDLYSFLLRDPNVIDWSAQPMDSLAVMKTPHSSAYDHWFLIAIERNDLETAFEIADRARRHRFFNTLVFGGRLLALRALLETPPELLDQLDAVKRQDFLTRFQQVGEFNKASELIRSQLETLPLVAPDDATARQWRAGLEQWDAVSNRQEAMLRAIAVRRESIPLIAPPVRTMKDIRESLPENQAILIFYAVGDDMYAYLMNAEDYDFWRVRSMPLVRKLLVEYLHSLGHYTQNRELSIDDLQDDAFKAKSQQLLTAIMIGSRADFTDEFPQLAIVPDGLLWYVPFESLHIEIDGKLRPLISRFALRYAPTASLAVPGKRQGRALMTETLVEVGKLYPQDDEKVAQNAFLKMSETLPRLTALYGTSMPGSTATYASLVKRLVVLDEIEPPLGSPYAWSPIQIDAKKPGNQLDDWMALPWGGPQVIILPGFRTPAEDGLKRANPKTPGRGMFLSLCAMMSGGADTVLISRWRPGGQSTFDLVADFLAHLDEEDAADAWRQAVYTVAAQPVDVEKEPRIRATADAEPLKANHPFFWSAFMLVDRGTPTKVEEEVPDVPELLGPEDAPEEGDQSEEDEEDVDVMEGLETEEESDDATETEDAADTESEEDASEDAAPEEDSDSEEDSGELQYDPIDGTIIIPKSK